ncbi:MAG: hypothetical protein ACT4P9_09875 [Betaproteobacteria bacterium]
MAWLACSGAQAAPFADPTQPPGATPGGTDSATGAPEGPRLQSVLIAPNRRVAVIGGQTVPLGGMYGEFRVVRISEGEVVLQAGQERQTLKLYADVEKRVSRPAGRVGVAHKGAGK